MTTEALPLASGAQRAATAAAWRTLAVAALVLLPMLAISLAAAHWAWRLQPLLPFEISNFEALRRLAGMLAAPAAGADDSWMPMLRALAVLHGPQAQSLYETLFFGDQVRFQYPPTSLLWLELLDQVGVSGARALNALNAGVYLLNALVIGALAVVLFRKQAAASPARLEPAGTGLVAAVCALVFYPVVRAEVLGQIQLWIDLLFAGAVLLWALDRRLFAGVLIGLCCTIKPQLGLVLLWGLLWRETRFVAGGAAVLAAVGAVSVARYGLHNHLEYLQVLSFLSRHGESFFTNQSVNGILNAYLSGADPMRWRGDVLTPFNPVVYAGGLAASLAALGPTFLRPLMLRRRRAGLADLGVAAICAVVASPVAWEHHYGLLLPLFLVGLRRVTQDAAGARAVVLPLLLLAGWTLVANLIPFAALLAGTPLRLFQAYALFGALALMAVLLAGRASPDAGDVR